MKPSLIIVRGVSGSGKSTFADFLATGSFVVGIDAKKIISEAKVFEADQWFIDNDEPWNPRFLHPAHQWCQAEVRKSLQDGYITVVSNTTTTVKELDPYVKIAKSLDVQYFIIIADGDYNNVHDVPPDKVAKQASKFFFNNTTMRYSRQN